MNTRAALLFLFLTFSIPVCDAAAPVPLQQSTIEDQKGIEVTVYNSNIALVKDSRKVTLPTGEGELRFMDVASSINPVTVSARSVNFPADFSVLDQNYEYDLISESRLLDKYVGKKLKLIRWDETLSHKEEVEATLLSNNDGQIYQIGDEIYLGYPGTKVVPSIPENLISKPTLTWLFSNKSPKAHELEVSYLTENISWKADYVATLAGNDKSLDLSGWVTIDNQSGAVYKNARLKLVAGEINRVNEQQYLGKRMRAEMMMASDAAAPQFQEKSFFEYHIYDLQRKTTIKDKQTKQISLLEASGVEAKKEFLVYGDANYYSFAMPGQKQKQDVNVFVEFKNSQANHVGMPLPQGTVRMYKKDTDASLQFIGEDSIRHTPKDEVVRLKIGKAFDVVAERVQTDFKQNLARVHESEWEVTVRNHKTGGIMVGILEPLYSDWKVLKSSHEYKKVDANTLRFDVPVEKDAEVVVRYRIQVKY
jgi:hypothetical protein